MRESSLCCSISFLEDSADCPGFLQVQKQVISNLEKRWFFELVVLEVLLTLAGMVLSMNFLGDEEGLVREGSLNSCIIQSVLIPLAALPL